MPGGRPLKFNSVEELQSKIDKYFVDCDSHLEEVTEWVQARDTTGKLLKDENGLNYLKKVTHKVMTSPIPYTFSGLALALDTSRETLLDYEAREEYSDSIKAARDKCQVYVEQTLFTAPNVTGAIFNLKNNYKWKDQTQVENSGEVTHKWEDMTDEQLEAALKERENRIPSTP